MSTAAAPARDALNDKANRFFAGKVVRKDLVRKVKVGANVPVFVRVLLGTVRHPTRLRFRWGCNVKTLASNYIRADESMSQATVKDRGAHVHRQSQGPPR
jgi:ATP-dependent Lon protease